MTYFSTERRPHFRLVLHILFLEYRSINARIGTYLKAKSSINLIRQTDIRRMRLSSIRSILRHKSALTDIPLRGYKFLALWMWETKSYQFLSLIVRAVCSFYRAELDLALCVSHSCAVFVHTHTFFEVLRVLLSLFYVSLSEMSIAAAAFLFALRTVVINFWDLRKGNELLEVGKT